MKKFMLLCSVALLGLSTADGTAASGATSKKTLIVEDDPRTVVNHEMKEFIARQDVVLIAVQPGSLEAAILENHINYLSATARDLGPEPVAILPQSLSAEPLRVPEGTLYKMPRNLKNKFHPEHLFHPLKRC